MTQLLAGDIGGTKTILRLVETGQTLYEATYASAKYPDLVPMVRTFLQSAAEVLAQTPAPTKACFGIAGPVVNNSSNVTNLGWVLTGDRLTRELHLEKVALINDFAAVGYGVLGLSPEDLCCLQSGDPEQNGPIAVIGAGTGLGQGYLIHNGQGYCVFGSEGGHADFAPRSVLEFELSHYLMEKHNIDRLSVERVVSGQGVVSIYQFLRDRHVADESPEIAQIVRTWESELGHEKTVQPAAAIGAAALEKRDPLSEQTLQLFISAYGAEAGNLGLKLLPYGGLYIAGGIAAKLLPLIEDGTFLAAFHHKGRMRPLLERIPVHIVLNPQVGLIGAALYASRL
ncbi:MAG: glucokinase [Alkalinema sp. RU_4_3]|nr:glucokinase [Alkalinema sp. RU_4_3]